jgi:lycopene cyclase domain-containing protein
MTYLSFLLLFVVLPIAGLCFRLRRRLSAPGWGPLALLLAVVYAATSPWDNAAVAKGFWSFDPERILGLKLGWLPLEEYLFFGLQTLLTGLWFRDRLWRAWPRQRATP